MAEEINLFKNNDTEKDSQVHLVGSIAGIFFESPDSFFKVVLVDVDENDFDWEEDQIVATGSFADLQEGEAYSFIGRVVNHPKYGQQLQVETYSRAQPTSSDGLITYFSSSVFKGIGKKTAERIVDALGTNAIDMISSDKNVLKDLGLSTKQQDAIYDVISHSDGMEKIIVGLGAYGFGSTIAARIFKKYQENTLSVIEEDPYQLAIDIEGIGFKKADQLARQFGIGFDFASRIDAGILHVINEWYNNTGNTYIISKDLVVQVSNLLEVDGQTVDLEKIADQVIELAKKDRIVGDGDRVYLKWMYNAEVIIAGKIKLLTDQKDVKVPDGLFKKLIRNAEKKINVKYDDTQRKAILNSLESPISIVTGGPGTGKTTIIKGFLQTYADLHELSLDPNQYTDSHFPIMLAAPTGRAAKRITEVTNVPAKTIHRLLGINGNDSLTSDEELELSGGLLIVDEMSMVDVALFKKLIQATDTSVQVVLVGDQDQLPSVGPGQVFHDLIKSGCIPTVKLNNVHRQSSDSTITDLAHAIQKGQLPDDFTQNKSDRSFFATHANQVEDVIEQVVDRAMDRGFSKTDIQVLSPMYRGSAGVDQLNKHLQRIMNPPLQPNPKKIMVRDQEFRIGDKVLQLVNAPENNVFNGDIGEIVGMISKGANQHIIVNFDDTEVTYSKTDWNQLTLAYCISIHKSQGSEFKMIIMPLVNQFSRMLQRNLLYTGITRASSFLILLGEQSAYQTAVEHVASNRKTTLILRLTGNYEEDSSDELDDDQNEKKEESTVKVSIINNNVDPMIGMKGISPYDFMN